MERKTILVVDNGETIRETLVKILEREGYSVLTAEDGQVALNLLKDHKVNLILSDVCMPRIDGNKLLKMAKTIQPDVEVILMTGHGKTEMGLEALRAGAFDFIQKPFTKLSLNKTVKQALERQAMSAEMRFLKERVRELLAEIMELVGEPAVHRMGISRTLRVDSAH
ncbi:MAG TPA: response regulator [Thermodesulfobacteriota bacterium]|nr:response regulator [Thermodesulfobacteriota bacterium]